MLNLYINDFNIVFRLEIVLVIYSGQHSVRVVCSELTHLENYTQPHAPGKVLSQALSPCQLTLDTLDTLAEIRLINIILHKLTPIYFRSGFSINKFRTLGSI